MQWGYDSFFLDIRKVIILYVKLFHELRAHELNQGSVQNIGNHSIILGILFFNPFHRISCFAPFRIMIENWGFHALVGDFFYLIALTLELVDDHSDIGFGPEDACIDEGDSENEENGC